MGAVLYYLKNSLKTAILIIIAVFLFVYPGISQEYCHYNPDDISTQSIFQIKIEMWLEIELLLFAN